MSTQQLTTASKAGITTKVINPLLAGVGETFETMLGSRADRQQLCPRPFGAALLDVTAVIGISSEAKGSIGISFAEQTAIRLCNRLLDINAQAVGPDVLDAMGELVNIVAGSTKSKLDIGLNIGLPQVLHGCDQQIDFPKASQPLRLVYASDLGPFCVDFGFIFRA
ncbi:MAG: chemotaxis protein CheX [Planctomycetota bacterium]